MPDRFAEMNQLADLSTEILNETGEFIHAHALLDGFLQRAHAADARSL
jgi:hypothetical protein